MLARSLVQEPKVLLLDEPTTYLDAPSKKELIQNLLLIKNSLKIKIIMSTHDFDLFSLIVDEVWHLKEEKIAILAPDSLKNSGASDIFNY
jgi:iron complex transport system ATP-binding protein